MAVCIEPILVFGRFWVGQMHSSPPHSSIIEARGLRKMGLNKVGHGFKTGTNHAESTLAKHSFEVGLALKNGLIEVDRAFEGCEAKIGFRAKMRTSKADILVKLLILECDRTPKGHVLEEGRPEKTSPKQGVI